MPFYHFRVGCNFIGGLTPTGKTFFLTATGRQGKMRHQQGIYIF
jgi:hypothetical protein